jgi:hypothetical protein
MRTPDDVINRVKERQAYEVEELEKEIDKFLDSGYLEFVVLGTYSDEAEEIVRQKYREAGWQVMVYVGNKWEFRPTTAVGKKK